MVFLLPNYLNGWCSHRRVVQARKPKVEQQAATPFLPLGANDPYALAKSVERGARYRMDDPRHGGGVDCIAFYHPGRDEPWDSKCGCGFLGNFYDMGSDKLNVKARGAQQQHESRQSFRNAEAAFQALKFWPQSERFRICSGDEAFHLKQQLSGSEDFTYGSSGSNWAGMLLVLRAKYQIPEYQNALKATDQSFLLEHSSTTGRDKVWSDNFNGQGTNWLGLQLMLLRDELNDVTGGIAGSWSQWLMTYCSLDPATGQFASQVGSDTWQNVVSTASMVVLQEHGVELCVRAGCMKPTWNGKRGEHCSRSCREQAGQAPRPSDQRILPTPSRSSYPAHVSGVRDMGQQPPVQMCGRPGCPHPTWNGQSGFCSQLCQQNPYQQCMSQPNAQQQNAHQRDAHQQQVHRQTALPQNLPGICQHAACAKPSWNGRPDEFCSTTCRSLAAQGF